MKQCLLTRTLNKVCLVTLFTGLHQITSCAPGLAAANQDWRTGAVRESVRNEQVVTRALRPLLKTSTASSRLYYAAICRGTGEQLVLFPRVELQPPPKGTSGLAAIRDMFGTKVQTQVAADAGIISVKIGKLSGAILHTKLGSLTLTPLQQYNPTEAISAMTSSAEFEAAKVKLNFREPVTIADVMLQEPIKGMPHLPKSINNITVDQALDLVAKVFRGIVIYGECTSPGGTGGTRFFTLHFAPVAEDG